MKEIYVFLDWSLTISWLIKNNEINKLMFNNFLSGLIKLEQAFSAKVKLFIVSGATKKSASMRNTILKNAFENANRSDIYCGFAYEYGGFYLDASGKTYRVNNKPLNKNKKESVLNLARKYNLQNNFDYNLLLSFDGENCDKQSFINFYNECKKLNNLSYVYYNDCEGFGCDIKNKQLNKGEFVKWILKNKQPSTLIVGGDDNEDLAMAIDFKNAKTYFIGFKSSNYDKINCNNLFLSKFNNVEGIVDGFNFIINN